MYPVGNTPFDWEEFIRQRQRQMSASGGVPPLEEPSEQPVAALAEDAPVNPAAVEPPPVSQAQRTAKEVFGIGSTGALAQQADQGVDAYNAKRAASFKTLGQHEPQQFGSIEGTFLAEGPMKPKDAVEAFMAKKTPDEIARYSKMTPKVVSPQEQLAKNKAYDEKVEQDRMQREQQRDRQREQGYLNRAATRDKTAAAWEQTLGLNALQGAGPLARGGGGYGGGVQSRNVGGAILLGPGMGEPQYGYGGRGGYRGGLSPEQYELRAREIARLEAKDKVLAGQGDRKLGLTDKSLGLKEKGLEQQQGQFDERIGLAKDAKAEDIRLELDKGVKAFLEREAKAHEASGSKWVEGVDEDLTPWKKFERGAEFQKYADTDPSAIDPATGKPGYLRPGSYGAMADRLVMLAKRLKAMKAKGIDIGEIAPDTNELLGRLARERGFE